MNRRIGKFSMCYIDIGCGNTRDLQRIMSKMIILRAEMLAYNNTIEYYANSDMFEEVKEGEMIPEYRICISETMIWAERK